MTHAKCVILSHVTGNPLPTINICCLFWRLAIYREDRLNYEISLDERSGRKGQGWHNPRGLVVGPSPAAAARKAFPHRPSAHLPHPKQMLTMRHDDGYGPFQLGRGMPVLWTHPRHG